jgi:hypothetical protein
LGLVREAEDPEREVHPMATDVSSACRAAKDEMDRLERELRHIAEFYFAVGSGLEQSPPRLKIANTDLAASRNIGPDWMQSSVDYLSWPDKESVKETLRAYYDAENAYAQAWRTLPSEARSRFPRPRR